MELGGESVSGPRPYNEDSYLFVDLSDDAAALGGLTAFAIVSDGMGGHQSGDVASRVAVEAARAYIDDLRTMARGSQIKLDVAQALREISSEAHHAVVRAAEEHGGSNMGATLVAAFISGNRAWIGHVGDSRAYLVHNGTARQLTVDHSQVGRMISEGILTEEQAQHHPQRNVIERALGFEGTTAEVTQAEIESGDAVILCSDGLSTVLTGADLAAVTSGASSAQEAARRLTEEAVKAGTDDNTTAVIMCDDWDLLRASAPRRESGRRAASKARRDALRHRRASRTSVVFGVVALIAIAALAFGAVMSTRPTAGRGSQATAPVTGPAAPAQDSTGTPNPGGTIQPDVSSSDSLLPSTVWATPKDNDGVWLRSVADLKETGKLVQLKNGVALRPTKKTPDGKYYLFDAVDVQQDSIAKQARAVGEDWRVQYPVVYGFVGSFSVEKPTP